MTRRVNLLEPALLPRRAVLATGAGALAAALVGARSAAVGAPLRRFEVRTEILLPPLKAGARARLPAPGRVVFEGDGEARLLDGPPPVASVVWAGGGRPARLVVICEVATRDCPAPKLSRSVTFDLTDPEDEDEARALYESLMRGVHRDGAAGGAHQVYPEVETVAGPVDLFAPSGVDVTIRLREIACASLTAD